MSLVKEGLVRDGETDGESFYSQRISLPETQIVAKKTPYLSS